MPKKYTAFIYLTPLLTIIIYAAMAYFAAAPLTGKFTPLGIAFHPDPANFIRYRDFLKLKGIKNENNHYYQ